ncbi:MAG: hypothetical protein ABIA78_01435 [archaeon]
MSVEDKIKKVFKETWNIFSNQFVVLILGTLVAILMMLLVVTIPPMIFGIYILCMNVMNGKKAKVSDVFKGFNYFFRSWGLFLLYVLGIIGGLVLLIVPGILLMIVWQYAFVIAVMENKGVIESLKRSYHLGKKNFAFSAILFIIVMIISTIGSLTRIGVLVTVPFITLATMVATKMLSKGKKKSKKK